VQKFTYNKLKFSKILPSLNTHNLKKYFFESVDLKHFVTICRPLGYTGKLVYLPLRKEEGRQLVRRVLICARPNFIHFQREDC